LEKKRIWETKGHLLSLGQTIQQFMPSPPEGLTSILVSFSNQILANVVPERNLSPMLFRGSHL
jgi:hypothetical protein